MNRTSFLTLQAVVFVALVVSWARLTPAEHDEVTKLVTGTAPVPRIDVPRERGHRMTPLYDEPEVVSDADLAVVLERVRPRFDRTFLRPNHVEHALRTWGVDATFEDPACLSGEEMTEVLTNHGQFMLSWATAKQPPRPLLIDEPGGVAIRWSKRGDTSVHHDHWLASLTEAGVRLDRPVFTPAREQTIEDVLQLALRDFRLDEREVEWSAMAFGLWLPPETKSWRTADGRRMSFDLIARRLMRGHQKYGTCVGTHRVYSLMLLWNLDQQYDVLAERTAADVYAHLEFVRDVITASQHEEGYWHADWMDGAIALEHPSAEPEHRKIIATGHHLEWLAYAPKELHPPREQILKAAKWIVESIRAEDDQTLRDRYTFYSHVGTALAAWRGTRPNDFWQEWRKSHPYEPKSDAAEYGPSGGVQLGGDPE